MFFEKKKHSYRKINFIYYYFHYYLTFIDLYHEDFIAFINYTKILRNQELLLTKIIKMKKRLKIMWTKLVVQF